MWSEWADDLTTLRKEVRDDLSWQRIRREQQMAELKEEMAKQMQASAEALYAQEVSAREHDVHRLEELIACSEQFSFQELEAFRAKPTANETQRRPAGFGNLRSDLAEETEALRRDVLELREALANKAKTIQERL